VHKSSLERTLKLEIRRDPIGFWDTKGLRDFSFNQPGFTVVYPHLDASFTLSKDRSGLEQVRLSEPL
jgi:hypothetical protein